MAEEKKMNKNEETKTNVADQVAPAADVKIEDGFNLSFKNFSVNAPENLPPHREVGGNVVFTTTAVFQVGDSVDEKGKKWVNFGICIGKPLPDGTSMKVEVFLSPTGSSRDTIDVLEKILKFNKVTFLEILRSPNYDRRTNEFIGYRYTPQVSYVEDGIEILSCPLKPSFKASEIMFRNALSEFRRRGEIV